MNRKTFCLAPFFHSHVDVETKNRLCCIATNDLVEKKFQSDLKLDPVDFWKSPYMVDRRAMMVRGEAPPECKNCIHANTATPYYQTFDDNFLEKFEKDKEIYTKNFANIPKPVSIDYRTSTCNLKCVMCVPSSSSAMNAHFEKHSNVLKKEFGTDFTGQNAPSLIDRTFLALDHFLVDNEIEHIYFAGGEPTLAKDHFETLDKLSVNSSKIKSFSYNTNLMQREDFLRKWTSHLLKFDDVVLYCSIDALGEIGEFLRVGFKQEVFDRNIDYIVSDPTKKIRIILDVTITSLGLFSMIELAKYALKHRLEMRGRIVYEMTNSPFTSVGMIDKKMRKKIVNEFKFFYETLPFADKKLLHPFFEVLPLVLDHRELNREELRKCESAISVYKTMYPEFKSYSEYLKQESELFNKRYESIA